MNGSARERHSTLADVPCRAVLPRPPPITSSRRLASFRGVLLAAHGIRGQRQTARTELLSRDVLRRHADQHSDNSRSDISWRPTDVRANRACKITT